MSAFLWVEDFEGKQYGQFAHSVFGNSFGLDAPDFPNEENALREFLADRQVLLATTYAEAARLIDERLGDIDGVVLDIDLDLLGEEVSEDLPWVEPVLSRWYGYDSNATDIEMSYNTARDKMKIVAGYHLFLELVLARGFQRSRILFCSNHGNHLESIKNSFEPARIETPEIMRKGEPRVGQWVTELRKEPYSRLRRWIILACREMLTRLEHGQTKFLMPHMPGVKPKQITDVDAANLLKTLPELLPAPGAHRMMRRTVFRLFVRTLTQDWDKVDYKDKTFKLPVKAFASVLVNARNWTSHDAKALSCLDESDLAFLFMIALRSCFDGLRSAKLENFEEALLQLVGEASEIPKELLKNEFERSSAEINALWMDLPDRFPTTAFASRVNALEQAGMLPVGDHEQRLRQILWHQLHWGPNGFAPRQSNFDSSEFLKQLMQRIHDRSFGTPFVPVLATG